MGEPEKPAAPEATPEALDSKAEEALKAFAEGERKRERNQKKKRTSSPGLFGGFFRNFFKIWDEPSVWGRLFMSLLCIGIIFAVWFIVTAGGPSEARMVSRITIGTPLEVFGTFPTFWADTDGDLILLRNILASFSRVIEGFLLALLIGIPIGILGGTFRRIDAFFAPVSTFFRNVPISALLPLTMAWFGIDEAGKVGFIFIACFAFVMFSAAQAISSVGRDYVDTAFTLGASRRQVLTKVLIPLAMPDIFNSTRLLFGLAFGYIVMAEIVAAESGLGRLIMISLRRSNMDHVYLAVLTIAVMAFLLDRFLYLIQRQLFPFRYGRR